MMIVTRVWIAALLCAVCAGALAEGSDAYSEVDPFIGTQGGGHTFPGATVPFGMIQLSPDTLVPYYKQSYPLAAGYQYQDPTSLGFSHTHFAGA
jgi:putative alpha-1,2-mannosidase